MKDHMSVFPAEQWADALHQWLGITDDCVHMVAKVCVLSSKSMQNWFLPVINAVAHQAMHLPDEQKDKFACTINSFITTLRCQEVQISNNVTVTENDVIMSLLQKMYSCLKTSVKGA